MPAWAGTPQPPDPPPVAGTRPTVPVGIWSRHSAPRAPVALETAALADFRPRARHRPPPPPPGVGFLPALALEGSPSPPAPGGWPSPACWICEVAGSSSTSPPPLSPGAARLPCLRPPPPHHGGRLLPPPPCPGRPGLPETLWAVGAPPPMLMAGASFAAGPVCCVVCGPTCPGRNRAAPMRAVAPDGSAAPPFHPKACSCRSKRKAQGKIQFKPRVKHVGPVTRSESAQTGG